MRRSIVSTVSDHPAVMIRLVDEEGRPVPDLDIVTQIRSGRFNDYRKYARTDADGPAVVPPAGQPLWIGR